MSNYDHDVLGVGNFEHPANEHETEGMNFDQAMDSLTPEQREAIEGEFIDKNAQIDRYHKQVNIYKYHLSQAKILSKFISVCEEKISEAMQKTFGEKNGAVVEQLYEEIRLAGDLKKSKEEELKNLLLGL